jgi:hypothetical protein
LRLDRSAVSLPGATVRRDPARGLPEAMRSRCGTDAAVRRRPASDFSARDVLTTRCAPQRDLHVRGVSGPVRYRARKAT